MRLGLFLVVVAFLGGLLGAVCSGCGDDQPPDIWITVVVKPNDAGADGDGGDAE